MVNPLAGILIGDWVLETGEPLQKLIDGAVLGRAQPVGTANVQTTIDSEIRFGRRGNKKNGKHKHQ